MTRRELRQAQRVSGYEYKSHGPTWVRTTETTWSRVDEDLEWTLRYGSIEMLERRR